MEMKVGDRYIGEAHRPFIIAEMSGNHNQSLTRALEIVDRAADSGADALKIQTYTADTMTLDHKGADFEINQQDSLWKGKRLYDLYKEAYTPWEWHEKIFERCRERGIIGFSTPFDASSVDFLESLHVPMYKIASFENTDLPLIEKVAATGKPVIISTGLATVAEIAEMTAAARGAGCRDLVLLKCTSSYPATPENSNIRTIPNMKEVFRCQVGLSDHTLGTGAAVASVALGASVIEKHFTLNRKDGGVDSQFSLEPEEMKALVTETERAWEALGSVRYGPTDSEKGSGKYRRSLYITEDMKAGDVLTESNLRAIRPGFGMPVKYMEVLLGKKINADLVKGTPMSWKWIG
ncbi:pseudaminic acid synthase [Bacillus sp. SB49]|uniref:pseudaminic acid synthase n=1 Tax=Bacillus sp. SB49 TaxID=1071080 RepID=UPI000421DFBA|nr:pseudaminic acid synthase [Bacillus sp. SB49]QHT45533.1 pseudaminic acid synthase [Bacillus sp. SB49]